MNDREKNVLGMQPKFAVYKKIDIMENVIEAETAVTKLRWEHQFKDITEEYQPLYNGENNSFDLKRTKATDVPFNKRVQMPQPHCQEIELKIRYAKEKIRHTLTNYSANHKGFENIDKEIETGIKKLKKRIKEDKTVVYPTHKSGRLSVDTHDNYKESMKKHLVNISETNITEYR